MTRKIFGFGFVVAVAFTAPQALAGEPAAVVEGVSPGVAGVEFMSYLEAGQTFKLGPGQSATLGYLLSCIKETIDGGVVTVGIKQSTITGGKVKRVRVECDGGKLNLTAEQAGKSAVTVFRAVPGSRRGRVPKPQLTLFATSPLVSLIRKANSIKIERLDKKASRLTLDIATLVTDLAKHNIKLEPGGIYRLTVGERKLVFKIDPLADESSDSVLQRLLRL